MPTRHWILVLAALRIALYSSGCTTVAAPTMYTHPMLAESGAPHSVPLANQLRRARFDGNPNDRADDANTRAQRAQIAQYARSYLGQRRFVVQGKKLPFDCSGLARAVYLRDGIDIMQTPLQADENAVNIIYDYARRHGIVYRHGKPEVGDLLFFNDTYDRNHNGRRDDPMTHIAVVESVRSDGTITLVHTVAGGVLRYRMNLRYPNRTRDPKTGLRVNHYLRRKSPGHKAQTTAALFAGYATIITTSRQKQTRVAAK